MSTSENWDAEVWLRSRLSEYESQGILISERQVIERLLKRSLEMQGVYRSIAEKISPASVGKQWNDLADLAERYPNDSASAEAAGIVASLKQTHNSRYPSVAEMVCRLVGLGREAVLDIAISTAAFDSPGKVKERADSLAEAKDCLADIVKSAEKLAELISRYKAICEKHGVSAPADSFDPSTLIDLAAMNAGRCGNAELAYRYESYPRPELLKANRFDGRYLPGLPLVLDELADICREHVPAMRDDVSIASVASRKRGNQDFINALDVAVANGQWNRYQHIPTGFQFAAEQAATFANCALGLNEDDSLHGKDVSGYRKTAQKTAGG